MTIRVCPDCDLCLPVHGFYSRANGLPSAYCKVCTAARVARYRRGEKPAPPPRPATSHRVWRPIDPLNVAMAEWIRAA